MLLNQANALSSDSFIRGIENGLRQAVAEGLGRLYSLSIADLTAGSRVSGRLHGRAPVAQLDSASVFGTEGCRFESYRACFAGHQQTPTALGVRRGMICQAEYQFLSISGMLEIKA